jgi:hypothetical protein
MLFAFFDSKQARLLVTQQHRFGTDAKVPERIVEFGGGAR